MYSNRPNNLQLNLSGLGCWLTVIAIIWLLGAIGLGWLVKSIFVLMALILIAPVLAFIGFRWWLQRNLVEGNCPVCQTPLTGLKNAQTACPNCQTPLQVKAEGFQRYTPEGTVEVNAVDISNPNAPEEGTDSVEVNVEVLPPEDHSDREA